MCVCVCMCECVWCVLDDFETQKKKKKRKTSFYNLKIAALPREGSDVDGKTSVYR